MMIFASALFTLALLGLALALIAHTLVQEKDRILSALAGKGAARPVSPVLILHRPANDDAPKLRAQSCAMQSIDLGFAA